MEFRAIQAIAGGCLLLLALAVVWLAKRLKHKNEQLRKALAELQGRTKETQIQTPADPLPIPIVVAEKTSPRPAPKFEPASIVDAFLWEHLGDTFLWKHLSKDQPAPVQFTSCGSEAIPTGMHDRAALQSLLEMDLPFTGLVVLIGIARSRIPPQEHPAEPFIAELLGPSDFACRNSDDEFLIICPGLRGAEAQRHLNGISERLWNFQLHGQGSFSVLFSWGGIGADDEPLLNAIASATERMQQTKRSRVLLFR